MRESSCSQDGSLGGSLDGDLDGSKDCSPHANIGNLEDWIKKLVIKAGRGDWMGLKTLRIRYYKYYKLKKNYFATETVGVFGKE